MNTQQRATLRDFIHDADGQIIDVGDPMMLVDELQCINGKVIEIKTISTTSLERLAHHYEDAPGALQRTDSCQQN